MGSDLIGLLFFALARKAIRHLLNKHVTEMLNNMIEYIGLISLTLVTFWFIIEGYRIMTGQSRTPMTAFVVQMTKVVVIVSIATNGAIYNEWVMKTITNIRDDITYVITDSHDDVYDQVDKNLAIAQSVISITNSLTKPGVIGGATNDKSSAAMWSGVFGTAGPAIVAGIASLLNEIMLAIAIAFGPLFIMGLLFEQTKQLFWNWVKYCFGLICTMGILAIMTSIAMKISMAYSLAIVAQFAASKIPVIGAFVDMPSFSNTMMVQGGLGLLLCTLLITIPPMTMQFFSVSLGGGVTGFGQWVNGSGGAGGDPGKGHDTKSTPVQEAPDNTPVGPQAGGKVLANPTTNQQPHGELSSGEHRAPAVPATPEARAARMNEIRGQMSAAGYTGETAQGNFHQPSDLLSWNRGGMADSGKHDMFGGDKKMQALQTEYSQLRSMQPQSGGSQK